MEKDDVRSGISKSWEFLDSLSLGQAFVTPTPLSVDEEFRKLILSENSKYTDIYEYALAHSVYNIVLNDLAFFQFGWSGVGEVRYAYYPNPFISGNVEANVKLKGWRELQEADYLSEDDVSNLISSLSTSATVPLIRYENSPSQYKHFEHPCSHMHIGLHGDNRWPLSRTLTPLTFAMWIVKQYYGEAWRSVADPAHDLGNPLEQSLIDEQGNCRLLGDALFSVKEAMSPHFR